VTDRTTLSRLTDRAFITDGGMETDLIFHRGWELPHFAAFVLLDDERGIEALRDYYLPYVALAQEHGVGLVLDTPTWRANPDWGTRIGYSRERLEEINRRGVELLVELRRDSAHGSTIVICGCVGPRGDGYQTGAQMTAAEAHDYHAWQIETFAGAAVDLVSALTLTYSDEAVGIVRAAAAAGVPAVISFTVETDGRLPSGQPLRAAIEQVDGETGGYAAYFMVNCAHPTHVAKTFGEGGSWRDRLRGFRANASTKSHAQLDQSHELDEGDPLELAESCRRLAEDLPSLTVLGGCCGTDHRHIAAICEAAIATP
jgi:homocysteine S-methyltransferase